MPMAMSIILNFKGDPTMAYSLASLLVSTPIQDKDNEASIKWYAPSHSLGIADSTIELLGTLGVISLPISILAGVIANDLTRRLNAAKSKAQNDVPETKNGIQNLIVSVTFIVNNSKSIVEIKLAQSDEATQIALTNALKKLADVEDTTDNGHN
jgi:hypothetical protein